MRKKLLFGTILTSFVLVGIAAAAKPATVTLSAKKPVVVYGSTVKLYGKVSSHQAGESVTVLGREYGTNAFSQVDVAASAAGGAWSYLASPQIQTSYQAQWGTATSGTVTVKVRPQIVLSLVSRSATRGTFSAVVNGNRAFTGKRVLVERLTASGPTAVKTVRLDSSSTATFTIRLPKHRARVRVVISSAQAAPGYIAGFSNVWKSS